MIRWPRPFFSSLLLATLVLLEGGTSLAQMYGARQTTASDWYTIILAIGAVVGIIMLFAQVKLFSIASSLKEILEELRKRDGALPKE